MDLQWEHQIYNEDFTTTLIYLDEFDRIIEALEAEYTAINRELNNSDIYNMNSNICEKVIEYTTEIQEEYKLVINQIESLKRELR